MTLTTRRRFIVALVAFTAVVVCAAGRGWLSDTASAFAEAEDLRQVLRDEEEIAAHLQAQTLATKARVETKLAMIEELIAGRATLEQAAQLFRELNAAYPHYFEMMRVSYPGLSDNELVCRNVIDYCSAALENRPERTAVLTRLDDEFSAMRALNAN